MCDGFDCIHSAFEHNSTVAKNEPSWGDVDKNLLPDAAFARKPKGGKKSTRGFPHHWVQGGAGKNADGEYTAGKMFLHRGGLKAAWSAANGGRSGDKAEPSVIAHLRRHWDALGVKVSELAELSDMSVAALEAQDTALVKAGELPITFLPPSIHDRVMRYLQDV